jgi:hypothetical protein
VAAGDPVAFQPLGSIGPEFNRATTTRSDRDLPHLRLPGPIGPGFNRAAIQRQPQGPGRPSASRLTWLPVRSGGDDKAVAGLWPVSGFAVGLGPSSTGQRRLESGRASVVLRLPCPFGPGFNRAATTRSDTSLARVRRPCRVGSGLGRPATTRPYAVFVGLWPPGLIRSGFGRAATTRPHTVLAGLWPPGLVRSGSIWRRLEVVGGGPLLALGMLRGPIPLGVRLRCLVWRRFPQQSPGSLRRVSAPALPSLAPVSRTSLGIGPSLLAWR